MRRPSPYAPDSVTGVGKGNHCVRVRSVGRVSATGGPRRTPLRVLLADDTPDQRDLLRIALERTGEFQVVAEAANGEDAVRAAARQRPDVVLLDIAMPVMDGFEALPAIRLRCPGATVMMLADFGSTELTGRALSLGADGCLQKGQPLGKMLAQVRAHVAKSGVRRSSRPAGLPSQGIPAYPEDHLEHAPFGFLQLRLDPAGTTRGTTVVRSNREAGRLLGDLSRRSLTLEEIAPALAAHLTEHPAGEATAVLDLGDPPRQITVSSRASGDTLAVYLVAQSGDEAELLRRAIATAAHEIRNPVSVLMGVAETLGIHGHELSPDQYRRMLTAIDRQTRMLDNMTADLLAAGQAQHGTLAMQLEEVDAVALAQSLLDDGFELAVEADDLQGHPCVLTDPTRFQQMLGNLMSNARKYGEAPYVLRVRTAGPDVLFDVEDSGPGVPEEFRPRLFQEYSRASGTAARGTGLGLFVVRALAEAQRGTVSYAPRSPHGSVFTLALPAVVD